MVGGTLVIMSPFRLSRPHNDQGPGERGGAGSGGGAVCTPGADGVGRADGGAAAFWQHEWGTVAPSAASLGRTAPPTHTGTARINALYSKLGASPGGDTTPAEGEQHIIWHPGGDTQSRRGADAWLGRFLWCGNRRQAHKRSRRGTVSSAKCRPRGGLGWGRQGPRRGTRMLWIRRWGRVASRGRLPCARAAGRRGR